MTETTIRTTIEAEVDQDLLEEAQRQLGGTSQSEAINTALQWLVEDERAKRHRAYDNVQRMAAEGALDFDAIERADT